MARPTGLLRPNDWGLFDMFGNIEEWCHDPGLSGTSEREIRGGSANAWGHVLVTTRGGSFPIRIEFNSMGFRVCRTIGIE
jgi:formylglycine-generating enzyme required for sulfatase activity